MYLEVLATKKRSSGVRVEGAQAVVVRKQNSSPGKVEALVVVTLFSPPAPLSLQASSLPQSTMLG